MSDESNAVDFLTFVVKGLVDHPDDVKIERTVDEMGVLLTLDVHSEDMGKIIGRKGVTAKAIRTLLRVVGMRQNERVNMKITEPEGGLRFSSRDETMDGMSEFVQEEKREAQPKEDSPVAAGMADVEAAMAELRDDMNS